MKKKIPKMLGVVLTVVLVASLFGFAAPVSVSAATLPVINDWDEFDYPVAGALGGWFYDPTIGAIGPMAESIDGTLYANIVTATTPAIAATGSCTILAGVTAPADMALDIDGTAITLACTDSTADLVATAIRTAINANGAATTTVGGAGANLIFTAKASGTAGDGALTMADDTYTGGTVPAVTLAGGVDATYQVSTVTIGGAAPIAADVFNLAIAGYGVSATGHTTALAVAAALVADINAMPGLSAIVTATDNLDGTFNVTALTLGTAGAFTITVSTTSATATIGEVTVAAVDMVQSTDTVAVPAGVTQPADMALDIDGTAITLACTDNTATLVAAAIAAAINANGAASTTVVPVGATLFFTAKVAGAAGNVTLPMTDGVYTGGTVPAVTMTGGADAGPGGVASLLKSTDGGRSWSVSKSPLKYAGGAVVDMVCSSLDADILYVTDGNYVYKSVDAGTTFAKVADESLEKALMGDCGTTVTGEPITCLDVGYNANDDPVLFIGTKFTAGTGPPPDGPPSVLFIEEEEFPANWTDLDLNCWPSTPGGYTPYSIGCEPGFATSKKTMVVVSTPSDPISGNPETHVVYTTGSVCGWYDVAELVWDCVPGNSFEIMAASRIGFPDDYADTLTLFVGVVATGANGGDVYSVTPGPPPCYAIDRNVRPGLGGCTGDHTNIISLDIEGDTEEASIIAGQYDLNRVYCSSDGGWSWGSSKLKDPSGDNITYVLWVGDSALAATSGCDCAVSLSCGETVCTYWNQISLIATSIDCILDLDHSPGYLTDSETLYMVTACWDCCDQLTTSLFRYVGDPALAKTSTADHPWERVFCSTAYEAQFIGFGPWIEWVAVSPDFNETGAVFVANDEFDIFRSLDAGCSWARLPYPCDIRYISAWKVIDKETIIAGGAWTDAGTVYRTTRHGARPWEVGVWDAVGPGDAVSFDTVNGDTILLGDDLSQVFICEVDPDEAWADQVWSLVDAAITGEAETWVAFDPDYNTNNTIYAAAGSVIERCVIDPGLLMSLQTWYPINMYEPLGHAWGIQAVGDTTLYVGDCGMPPDGLGITVGGTIAVRYDCGEAPPGESVTCDLPIFLEPVMEINPPPNFIDGELVEIIEYNLACIDGVIYGEIGIKGHDSGAIGWMVIGIELEEPCCPYCFNGAAFEVISSFLMVSAPAPYAGIESGVVRSVNATEVYNKVEFERLPLTNMACCLSEPPYSKAGLLLTAGVNGCPDSNVVWTLGTDDGCCAEVWFYEDTLATPVIPVSPADAATLVTPTSAILEWESFCDATAYEIYVSYICLGCPEELRLVEECFTCTVVPACVGCSEETCCYILTGLTPGTTYYWKVRVCEDYPTLSKWSATSEFTTALGAVPSLCSPVCGAQDVVLTTNFSWDTVTGATSYEVQIATNEDFDPIMASGTATVNAWAAAPALDYDTTYYWRVRAVKDGVVGAWSVCIFTTEAEPAPREWICPQDGLSFDTEAELEAHWLAVHAPAEPVEPETPFYIWVIIAIGAVLAILVVVLILRTRRPV